MLDKNSTVGAKWELCLATSIQRIQSLKQNTRVEVQYIVMFLCRKKVKFNGIMKKGIKV